MNLVDVLNSIWSQILQVTSLFVIPDWGSVIGGLPVVIVLGLVAPFLTFLVLGTVIYQVRRPRVMSASRRARGSPKSGPTASRSIPSGCRIAGATAWSIRPGRSAASAATTSWRWSVPMCSLGRSALIDTCANCGLVLKVKNRAVAVRASAGPKPGGAAVA